MYYSTLLFLPFPAGERNNAKRSPSTKVCIKSKETKNDVNRHFHQPPAVGPATTMPYIRYIHPFKVAGGLTCRHPPPQHGLQSIVHEKIKSCLGLCVRPPVRHQPSAGRVWRCDKSAKNEKYSPNTCSLSPSSPLSLPHSLAAMRLARIIAEHSDVIDR